MYSRDLHRKCYQEKREMFVIDPDIGKHKEKGFSGKKIQKAKNRTNSRR